MASKAEEWAKRMFELQSLEQERPVFKNCRGTKVAWVTDSGRLYIDTYRFDADVEREDFIEWLRDTFEEPAPRNGVWVTRERVERAVAAATQVLVTGVSPDFVDVICQELGLSEEGGDG